MERTIVLLFACTAVEGYIGKHIFVKQEKNWKEAQAYCRTNHTDLSFVRSLRDIERLLSVSNESNREGWIGLQRDPNNNTAWIWSGGGQVTFQNWAEGEIDIYNDYEDSGHVRNDGKWNDARGSKSMNFYCVQITVVVEEKSWEEAMQHCRQKYTDLTSLASETERLLAQSEILSLNITERVWIGLRYLGGRWLWVNGDRPKYDAWPKGGDQDHLCPIRKRCGALTKQGQWENWDCQEKLNFICY